jgi:acetyl esterase
MRRDTGEPAVDRQVLCYPVLDVDECLEQYLGDLPVTPYAAPLRADSVAGLPPALVIGAGRDPLRDDARAYASRLEADGVEVRYVEYAETMHAILNFCEDLSAGRHLIDVIAGCLAA